MARTIVGLLVLFGATFWLPVWTQILLFVGAVLFLPFRLVFLIPAIFYDVFYSPTDAISFSNFKMTIIVFITIVLSEIMVRYTRVGQTYGILEK